jgi:L-threonylcarbamoyladenylate synthase
MNPDIAHLATILQRGGVVLLPTDTIYGLHAIATDAVAIARIAAIKGRDETKPFVVLGASRAQLESIGARFDDEARRVVDELWPGPVTAVVALKYAIAASRGNDTIAVRVPSVDWLRDLIQITGPLASTSVNRSGEPPLTSPKQLTDETVARIDASIDIGPLDAKPSTIVDLSSAEPRLIREGDALFTQKVWKTLRKSL